MSGAASTTGHAPDAAEPSARRRLGKAAAAAGMPAMVALFIASLLIPVVVPAGPISLPLYRLLLLLMFFPASSSCCRESSGSRCLRTG